MNQSRLASVLVILAVSFTGTAAFRVSIPAVSLYARGALEATALGVGMLTSAFFFSRALSAVFVGGVADKYGFRVTFLTSACFALNALAVQLYGLSGSIAWFAMIRLVQGGSQRVGWVSVQYVLGRLAPKDVRGRAFAVYFAAGTLGVVAGNALYSSLSNAPLTTTLTASSLLFLTASALTLVLSYIVKGVRAGVVASVARGPEATSPTPGLGLVTIIPLTVVVAGYSMVGSVVGGDLTYVYIKESLGIPKYVVADAVAASSIAALAGTYCLSWLSDRVGDRASLRLSVVVGLAGAFMMSLHSLPLVIAGRALATVGGSAVMSVSRKVAVTYYGRKGVAVGVINATGNAGKVLGSLVAGHLYDLMTGCTLTLSMFPTSCFMLAMTSLLLIPLLASITLPSGGRR